MLKNLLAKIKPKNQIKITVRFNKFKDTFIIDESKLRDFDINKSIPYYRGIAILWKKCIDEQITQEYMRSYYERRKS